MVVIRENINYYDGHIREQLASGKTEQEVMELLGDPRMIARTIIDTNGGDGDYNQYNYNRREDDSLNQSYNRDYEDQEDDYFSNREKSNVYSVFEGNNFSKVFQVKWYHKLLIALIIVAVLVIVGMIIMGIVQLAVWLAVPVLILFGIGYLIRGFSRK